MSLFRRHHSPISNHTGASVHLVPRVRDVGAISTDIGRHHHDHGSIAAMNAIAFHVILPVELIQRDISQLLLANIDLIRSLVAILCAHDGQALIELIQLAFITNILIVVQILDHALRLDVPSTVRVQRARRQQFENQRQTQANVHSLEQRKVTITQSPREDLLQTLPQQIHAGLFFTILAHLFHRAFQDFAQALGPFRCLRRVLRDVLCHGPQIQARSEIHVAQIRQHKVRLVSVAIRIIAWKFQGPTAFVLFLFEAHLPRPVATKGLVREAVTTIRALT